MVLSKSGKGKQHIEDRVSEYSKRMTMLLENNRDLARRNLATMTQMAKVEKLCQDLWIQHVADRLHLQKIWQDGWKSGYRAGKEDDANQMVGQFSHMISKMDISSSNGAPISSRSKEQEGSDKYDQELELKMDPKPNVQPWLSVQCPKLMLQFITAEQLGKRVEKELLSSQDTVLVPEVKITGDQSKNGGIPLKTSKKDRKIRNVLPSIKE